MITNLEAARTQTIAAIERKIRTLCMMAIVERIGRDGIKEFENSPIGYFYLGQAFRMYWLLEELREGTQGKLL